jgi:Zn-dependent protease
MSSWNPTTAPLTYSYAIPSQPTPGRFATSRKEILHIAVATAVLTADIALISLRSFPFTGGLSLRWVDILTALALGASAALTGFVFHELAHKLAAERRGYWAEFRMSPFGLFLSVVTAYLGFLFAAPGATVVQQMTDRRDWGRTSLAGPTVNLIEGGGFSAAAVTLATLHTANWLLPPLLLLAFFNGWFATFNLLPFGPLDGRKVLQWNGAVWAVAIGVSAALAVFGYAALSGLVSI